jgi:hypothetical protein
MIVLLWMGRRRVYGWARQGRLRIVRGSPPYFFAKPAAGPAMAVDAPRQSALSLPAFRSLRKDNKDESAESMAEPPFERFIY